MNQLKRYVLAMITGVAFAACLVTWVQLPSTLTALKLEAVIAFASLEPEGKPRLMMVSESSSAKYSCAEALFVCQYLRDHGATRMQILSARPASLFGTWLVSASVEGKQLLRQEATESRYQTAKFMLVWNMLLIGALFLGFSWHQVSRRGGECSLTLPPSAQPKGHKLLLALASNDRQQDEIRPEDPNQLPTNRDKHA